MSQENVEFVKGFLAAGADMDKQALLAALPEVIAQTCDPEIEWYEDPQRADGRVYRGHGGVRRVLRAMARTVGRVRHRGRTIHRLWRRRAGSRPRTRARSDERDNCERPELLVFTFREGKILRYREFYDEAAALEAVACRSKTLAPTPEPAGF